MADSLTLAGSIQFLGLAQFGGAQAPGARYVLAPGFDMGAPQPLQDIVAELILDGERPYGRRAGNRTITLPIIVQVKPTGNLGADRATLAAAVEVLLQTVDADDFLLTWTPEPPANGTPLPLVFECFRALPSVVDPDLKNEKQLVKNVTISFPALPYGRADVPTSVTFASAAVGSTPPPSPVTVDNFVTLGSGANFTSSTLGVVGANSAHWSSSSGGYPQYSRTFSPLNLTGLTVLSFYLGLGTTFSGYWQWSSGNVTFNLTLTDSHGKTISIGLSQNCSTSNNTAAPHWQQVTAIIPASATFDFTTVTGYSISCYNESGYFGRIMTPDVYLNDLVAQPVSYGVAASTRGQIYTLPGVLGSARAPLNLICQQAPVTINESVTLTPSTPSPFLPEYPVTSLTVEKWAGGAPGGSRTTSGQATGGKGGEYTKNTTFACSPLVPISFAVGTGGTASSTAPTDGGDTWFGVNDSTAAHGAVAPAVNASAAANTAHGVSTDPVKFAGGAPAAGATTGGGGGESGGPSGAGNAGGNPAGGTGNANAGDGGAGGAAGTHAGSAGSGPGGGGGGCSTTGATTLGGNGANGQIVVSWVRTLVPWTTLVAHRPGPDAPQNLSPFCSVGNGGDVPDGTTQYIVPSLTAGQLADFGGTYTMVAFVAGWNNPSASRSVSVSVYQYEYAGGPAYSVTTVPRTLVPSTEPGIANGLLTLGELTLPIKDVAPDNTTGYYAVAITSTNTSDRFLDVLALDVAGQLVVINSATAYPTFYIDEPPTTADLGRVLASAADRAEAISVSDQCPYLSGGPLTLEPGSNILMLYSPQGAPAAVASYFSRWRFNRAA